MNITVSTRHGNLSEAAQEKIIAKLEKLSKIIEKIAKVEVTVDLEKADQPLVIVSVVTEMKKEFNADYTSEDLYGCIDQIIDKLQQQMKKFKEKLTERR